MLSPARSLRHAIDRVRAVVFFVVLVGLVTGCGETVSEQFDTQISHEALSSGAVMVEELDRGQYGDIVEGTTTVLRSEDAYASFWSRLHADKRSAPDRPAVDFSNHVVVAIVLGKRSTGGYAVNIDAVRGIGSDGRVKVEYTSQSPGESCMVTQALTAPYVLAVVETTADSIRFEGTRETRAC